MLDPMQPMRRLSRFSRSWRGPTHRRRFAGHHEFAVEWHRSPRRRNRIGGGFHEPLDLNAMPLHLRLQLYAFAHHLHGFGAISAAKIGFGQSVDDGTIGWL